MKFIPNFQGPRPFTTFEEVKAAYSDLTFRVNADPESGGLVAFAFLGSDRPTGEVRIRAVIDRSRAKRHRHKARPGAPYRELICTIAGFLDDEDDEGHPVRLGPGDILVHNTDRPHAPSAVFWVGDYQPIRRSGAHRLKTVPSTCRPAIRVSRERRIFYFLSQPSIDEE